VHHHAAILKLTPFGSSSEKLVNPVEGLDDLSGTMQSFRFLAEVAHHVNDAKKSAV